MVVFLKTRIRVVSAANASGLLIWGLSLDSLVHYSTLARLPRGGPLVWLKLSSNTCVSVEIAEE